MTTQFRDDHSVDVDATARGIGQLVDDGVSGLIVCGTVGENTSLPRDEKVQLMEAARAVAATASVRRSTPTSTSIAASLMESSRRPPPRTI